MLPDVNEQTLSLPVAYVSLAVSVFKILTFIKILGIPDFNCSSYDFRRLRVNMKSQEVCWPVFGQ